MQRSLRRRRTRILTFTGDGVLVAVIAAVKKGFVNVADEHGPVLHRERSSKCERVPGCYRFEFTNNKVDTI